MIKKCCGNDMAAFAKLLHVTLYARTATDGNMSVVEIENTSRKVLAYGIYARVVDVSEIERVSAANE